MESGRGVTYNSYRPDNSCRVGCFKALCSPQRGRYRMRVAVMYNHYFRYMKFLKDVHDGPYIVLVDVKMFSRA